jgi:hypothetical protein
MLSSICRIMCARIALLLVFTPTIAVPRAQPLPFSRSRAYAIADATHGSICGSTGRNVSDALGGDGESLLKGKLILSEQLLAVFITAPASHAAAMVEIDVKRHNSAGQDACDSPLRFSYAAAALLMVACRGSCA